MIGLSKQFKVIRKELKGDNIMPKVIDYLLVKSLELEENLRRVIGTLKSQKSFNNAVAVFSWCCTAGMIMNHYRNEALNKKLDKLTKEVEEMKVTKGE